MIPKINPIPAIIKAFFELILRNILSAEEVRFELTTQLPGFRFSRAVPSTTRATPP